MNRDLFFLQMNRDLFFLYKITTRMQKKLHQVVFVSSTAFFSDLLHIKSVVMISPLVCHKCTTMSQADTENTDVHPQ